jgi:polysaccharide deacetylase family sporulation protein PdaB
MKGGVLMRTLIITKKQIITCCALLLAGIIGIVGSVSAFAGNDRKLPIYCVETEEKKIAISFDAAWGNDDTEQLINILAEYNVPATFFVVGAWVDKYPESVKQLHDAGHRVENHSNTHPYLSKLSNEQIANELESCNQKIANVTGRTPTLIRPPYGDYDNHVIEAVDTAGMHCIQWDVDSLDWKDNATAENIAERVVSKVQPGSIVLFHNDADHTPAALPTILKTLKEQGYEFVFIEDLILKENYEIKHDGTQCKKDG